MKKSLLISLVISVLFVTNAKAQRSHARVKLSPNAKAIPIHQKMGDFNQAPLTTNPSLGFVKNSNPYRLSNAVLEQAIGTTTYDLQTSAAISNRLLKHSDGTISASWILIPPGSSSLLRGTGYNYFDGINWGPIPTAAIDPLYRTGYPSLVVTSSGREMAFAHSNTAPGIINTFRTQKGTGTWTSTIANTGTSGWTKAIKGGSNGETIHTLNAANFQTSGPQFPLYYSRSLDEGATWLVQNSILPYLDSSHYRGFGGDTYSIDTKGDTVAFVVGDFTKDLVLMRSYDNGVNWTITIIQPFFKPLYDDLNDSFPDLNGDFLSDDMVGPSGDAHVMIDNLGKIHVWWSNVLMRDRSAFTEPFYFPNVIDGLLYWNDGFAIGQAPDTIAYALDGINANGLIDIPTQGNGGGNGLGGYHGSITQMPTSGVDANNYIYVAYQSYCEDCDTTAFNTGHKHIYMIVSTNQGATWSYPMDIDQTPDLLDHENVFACVAKNVDANCIHVIYQRDIAPGHSLSSNATEAGWNSAPSEIVYACVEPTIIGIKKIKEFKSSNFLSQNTPNPAEGKTTINYNVAANASVVSFTVTDVLGKVVYTENKGTVNAGTYSLVLDTEAMNSGVYFYTLTVNNQKETKKMMVK
ncbi:MAG: T9SS type A sorting domain-containing protein [Bacteroidetes bacterium]|nr:T9SS type A sorting domain-containing protein [Bacteroidota bacterium]